MKKIKENLRKTYNRIAEDWNKDHLNDDWWIEGTNKFMELVGKGKTVLDIGCGSGLKSRLMISRGLKVEGIDISEKMIEVAKKEVPKGNFSVMDMENIKSSKKYDALFAQACLLHVKKNDAVGIVRSWVDFVKPSGYLYIAVKESNKNTDEEIVKENDYGYDYERFFSYYTKDEIENYMKSAGLKIVYSTITFSGKTNWIQTIGKK